VGEGSSTRGEPSILEADRTLNLGLSEEQTIEADATTNTTNITRRRYIETVQEREGILLRTVLRSRQQTLGRLGLKFRLSYYYSALSPTTYILCDV